MIPVLLALLLSLAITAGVFTLRWRVGRTWAHELVAFKVQLPTGLSIDDVARWLGMVATSTRLAEWSLRTPAVFGIEVRATARGGIEHFILVPEAYEEHALQHLRAGLPGARIEAAPTYVNTVVPLRTALEMHMTTSHRALAVERSEAVATNYLMSLLPLVHGEEVRVSCYVAGAATPRLIRRQPDQSQDAEAFQAQRIKDREQQLHVCLRIGAAAANGPRAAALVRRTGVALRGLNAPGVRITPTFIPAKLCADRMRRRTLPLRNWQLFNTKELASVIGFPVGEQLIPGLPVQTTRQLPPPHEASRHGLVLARSTYPGSNQQIRLSSDDRLRHCWLLGPTGVGKSTLIANMALQEAEAGRGFVVVDPKSDLVMDILARLPESRHDDVIVLDPAAAFAEELNIVGINVLGQARTEHERELATDQIVYVLHLLWADSWGPRTADVLRNAILTLTHTRAADGTAFTLAEVAPLLEDHAFRRFVTAQPGVPDSVRRFWEGYNSYSDVQRFQIIGPSLNKLRALTTRTPLRLTLGQSVGIDVANVLRMRKLLLVPLSKGIIGMETAQLLGSLLVAQIVSAIFSRTAMPAKQRPPVTIYLDEFQDVLRLATDLPDALAQARGLGAGFVLANQYIHQLPEAAKRAVMGTVRSAVVYALQDYDDAKALERRFAPLTASELMHLPAYEIAAQLSDRNTAMRPVTGMTMPLPEAIVEPAELTRSSAAKYGMERCEIEEAMLARTQPTRRVAEQKHSSNTATFGRRRLDPGE